jgi:hypothetical protein
MSSGGSRKVSNQRRSNRQAVRLIAPVGLMEPDPVTLDADWQLVYSQCLLDPQGGSEFSNLKRLVPNHEIQLPERAF